MSTYQLPDGFPHKLTDDELDEALDSLLVAVRTRYGDAVGGWLPELQLALVTAALNEHTRRELDRGSRIAFASLLVGGLALVVAVVPAVVTLLAA